MSAAQLTYRETLKRVRDYLEVAFHTLLYIRQVYPAELFHQVKKYNVPVWQSRADPLNAYLGRVLECIHEELDKGTLRRIILVIKEASREESPLERFVFEFEWLIAQRERPKDGDDFVPSEHGLAAGDVEDLFRACLLQLTLSQSHLRRLTQEVTFAVVLEMRDDAPPPESKAARAGHVPAEWVPAEQRHAAEDDGEGPGRGRAREDDLSSIAGLGAVRLGVINMDMRVEETAQKFDRDDLLSSSGEVDLRAVRDRKGKGRAY
ncbi:DNA-binding protein [Rhodotorula diobovata]|uniref:DNA-binding protein n=1 Tax=Rhodotorula diobovata TaxID=5288 RepID=A0A5C5FTT6_9BASI|nr:DNA-binding protein [Rhodotorula diobovata]